MTRHLLIVDTETTTKNETVADFGAVLMDPSLPRGPDGYGQVIHTCGSYVYGEFNKKALWCDPRAPEESFWSRQNVEKRQKAQEVEVVEGRRMLAAAPYINGWLKEMRENYNPLITAYNWPFDRDVCRRTKINIDQFEHDNKWCLMRLARKHYSKDPTYIAHCKAKGLFTKTGNISFSCDSVSNFIFTQRGNVKDPEPHTALEDAMIYEMPIAQELYAHGWLDILKQDKLPTEETENATPEN